MALKIYQREKCRVMVRFKTYETKLFLEDIRFREDVTRASTWKIRDNSASKLKSRVGQEEVIPSEERAYTNGPDLVGRNKQCLSLTGGFPDSSVGKESACNAGDPSSTPGSRRSAGEVIGYPLHCSWASPVAQLVRNLPTMQETWVRKIPWKRERLPTSVFWPGEFHGLYSPWVRKESDTTERLSHFTSLHVTL